MGPSALVNLVGSRIATARRACILITTVPLRSGAIGLPLMIASCIVHINFSLARRMDEQAGPRQPDNRLLLTTFAS